MAENIEKKPVAETKKTTTKKAPTKKAAPKKVEETKVEATKEVATKTETKKVEKKAKKEEVVVAPTKPVVSEAKAKALSVKLTPRKARYVIDTIRGKNIAVARGLLLNNGHRDSSDIILKVVNSAVANAVNNYNMNEDKLYIAEIMASDSLKMKRYLPRAKGSASGLVKRFSNIFVTVKERN